MSNIISYDDFVGGPLLEKYYPIKRGCVMLEVELPHRNDLLEAFEPEDLSGPKFEPDGHITILFGLKDIYSLPDMTLKLAQLREAYYHGQRVILSGVSYFRKDEHDVIKYDAHENDFIYEMNDALSRTVEWEESNHTYKPHCTIAYVKPGLGDKYVSKIRSMGLEKRTVRPTFLIYSRPSRQKTQLFLNR